MHPLFQAFLAQTAGGANPLGSLQMLLPILLMFGVFYLVLWRPQSKERKKLETFRQNLKKGDRVWTQGGIIGTVTQVEEQTVMLDIGAGKVRAMKAFVGGEWREKGEAPEAKPEAKK